jgi:hypothetical protein
MPSWTHRRRLTGRLWNTTSCLTASPLTHSHAQLDTPETAHGPTLECHQLPHGSSTHSLTRPAGYTGDGSRADSGIPPAASRQLHSLTHTPSWIHRRRLTGRLWNTTSCLTVAPLTHSHTQLGIPETAHGPTLEYRQLPHGGSTHSLTRPAGYTGDGSRANSGMPPAASR